MFIVNKIYYIIGYYIYYFDGILIVFFDIFCIEIKNGIRIIKIIIFLF